MTRLSRGIGVKEAEISLVGTVVGNAQFTTFTLKLNFPSLLAANAAIQELNFNYAGLDLAGDVDVESFTAGEPQKVEDPILAGATRASSALAWACVLAALVRVR